MNKKVVLLVEDNDDDVELIKRSFEKHNLSDRLVVTRNGQEALDYLLQKGSYAERNPNDVPVLVLLDLKLPRIDGFEVLQQIRSHPATHCLPVVILTTSSQASDKLRSYKAGANSYVRKPVDFDQFMDITHQLGKYWLTLNDPPPAQS